MSAAAPQAWKASEQDASNRPYDDTTKSWDDEPPTVFVDVPWHASPPSKKKGEKRARSNRPYIAPSTVFVDVPWHTSPPSKKKGEKRARSLTVQQGQHSSGGGAPASADNLKRSKPKLDWYAGFGSFHRKPLDLGRELGSGAFGVVYEATDDQGKKYAWKLLHKETYFADSFEHAEHMITMLNVVLSAVPKEYLPCLPNRDKPYFDITVVDPNDESKGVNLSCSMGKVMDLRKAIHDKVCNVCPSVVILQLMEMWQCIRKLNIMFSDGKDTNFGWSVDRKQVVFLDLDTLCFVRNAAEIGAAYERPLTYTVLRAFGVGPADRIDAMVVFGACSFVVTVLQVLNGYVTDDKTDNWKKIAAKMEPNMEWFNPFDAFEGYRTLAWQAFRPMKAMKGGLDHRRMGERIRTLSSLVFALRDWVFNVSDTKDKESWVRNPNAGDSTSLGWRRWLDHDRFFNDPDWVANLEEVRTILNDIMKYINHVPDHVKIAFFAGFEDRALHTG